MRFFFVLMLSAVVVTGCIGKRKSDLDTQYVEGTVTLDGRPVEGVHLSFIPKTQGVGEAAGGVSQANGSYKLSSLRGDPGAGVLEGEYLITAAKSEIVELAKPKMSEIGDPVTHESKSVLPAVYGDEKKTPLSATVVRGKNKIDIALESKPQGK